jgi:hypothetical protein
LKKTSPIHKPNTKTQDTTDTGPCSERKFGAMCVPPKTKEASTKYKFQECNTRLCGFSRRGFMKEQRLVRKSFMCVYLLHLTNMKKKYEPLPGDVCKQFVTARKIMRL